MYAGFSDVKYFRTAFKKRYGMTISEYTKVNSKWDCPVPEADDHARGNGQNFSPRLSSDGTEVNEKGNDYGRK